MKWRMIWLCQFMKWLIFYPFHELNSRVCHFMNLTKNRPFHELVRFIYIDMQNTYKKMHVKVVNCPPGTIELFLNSILHEKERSGLFEGGLVVVQINLRSCYNFSILFFWTKKTCYCFKSIPPHIFREKSFLKL